MLRLIKFLFTGDWHLHQWEVLARGSVLDRGRPAGTYYSLQCKHCGKIKFTES